jgi:hypothetical protein
VVDTKLYVPAIPDVIPSGSEVVAFTQNLIASFEHEPLNKSFSDGF